MTAPLILSGSAVRMDETKAPLKEGMPVEKPEEEHSTCFHRMPR